ncbi:glycosyltransferase family 39 protein [Leptolyngbya sp. BC1307]|uniref:glycosyltransferase family 39 protein n=1 Tax=Leptolyngbya sp. BC1307 TaxID=2029589 RepID=UPI001481E581|nr:glycosyltransferase family 39 protein [Leptolyngbya sp. BC1307]
MTTNRLEPAPSRVSTKPAYRWLPISLILGAAAFLFTYRLGQESLWTDELFSVQDAAGSPFAVYKENQLRPLYYLLLKGWMAFGSGDAWLRSLSVVFAVISVFLIYRLGRRLAGESEGLIAALLLATSPLFINHAQEVRMYVVSLCLGLAGTVCLTDALLTERSQQPSQRAIAGWSLFRLLAIYTFPLNLTLLLPDVIAIWLRFRKERQILTSFGKWLLLLFVLWSPSVLSVVQEAAANTTYAEKRLAYSKPPGLGNLVYPLKFWMVWPFVVQGSKVLHVLYQLFTLVVAGLVGAGLIRKHKSPTLLLTAGWFVIPLIPIVAFSLFSAQIWDSRYVLFVSPYLFILMAAGFTRLWRQWRSGAIVAIAIYSVAISGALADYYTVQNRADYRFNLETVEQYEQPGDAIIWGYRWENALDYYYDGAADTYWRNVQDVDTADGIEQWVSQFPKGYKRWWVVINDPKSLSTEVENRLKAAYNIEQTFSYEQRSSVMLLAPLDKSSKESPAKPN